MRTIFISLLIVITSCHLNVDVTKKYQEYFDDETYKIFQKTLDAYKKQDHKLADSLLTIVIDNSKEKVSLAMPVSFNPYYYRGHNDIDLEKYKQALIDFDQVTTDTTTTTDIILARHIAFKMLGQYDTAISLCNRLLSLNVDSSVILSQRGRCYYLMGSNGQSLC